MTEHKASAKIRTYLLKHPQIYRWKINDRYTNGIPDAFIEGSTSDLWLESKHLKELPKRDSTIIDLMNTKYWLSKHQQLWLQRRYDKRGDCAVLLTAPEGGVLFFDRQWEKPICVGELRVALRPLPQIAEQILYETCADIERTPELGERHHRGISGEAPRIQATGNEKCTA